MTVLLAATAGTDRARQRPIIPLVLAAKGLADAANAGCLIWEQIVSHRALRSYCLVAAAATFMMVPAALPEARQAWRSWRRA